MQTAQEQISAALKNSKVSGSWLITGPFGVGKKTFARSLCSFLATGHWSESQSFNPNVKWIECDLTEEAKNYLAEIYGELSKIIVTKIEAEVNLVK